MEGEQQMDTAKRDFSTDPLTTYLREKLRRASRHEAEVLGVQAVGINLPEGMRLPDLITSLQAIEAQITADEAANRSL